MKVLRTLMVGVAATALMAGSAMAADLMMEPPAMEDMATGGDWDGFYAGVGITGTTSSTITENILSLDGIVGVNAQSDMFVLGAEGYIQGKWSDLTGWYAGLGGEIRGGVALGDAALLYGALGGEIESGGATYLTGGGGIEFMIADATSLDLEYKHYWGVGGSTWQGDSIGASVLFHF